MRINVYSEELNNTVEWTERHIETTGKTYYGLRLLLKSAPELHHEPNDDDRTAITFWFESKFKAAEYLNFVLNRFYDLSEAK